MGDSAHGSLLQVGDGASPESFTTIPGARDFSWDGEAAPTIDMTDHDSTQEESVPALGGGSSISAQLNLAPGNVLHQQLYADWKAGTQRNYQVVMPTSGGEIRRATCSVENFGHSHPVRDALTAATVLRVNSGDTFPAP